MSWYKSGSNPKIEVEKTPTKDKPQVQVPSSSPILIQSSPARDTMEIPSINQPDEAAQKSIENKRQAIRSHKDFPLIRKRFSYLLESAIFKGFVKGKGNLREITKYLNDNYNKDDILNKQREEEKHKAEEEARKEREQNFQKLVRDYELLEKNQSNKLSNDVITISDEEDKKKRKSINEEDESPIKVRSKSRSIHESPVKSQEAVSTKVELARPKISILDKYMQRKQGNILDMMSQKSSEPNKKRKLVRLSSLKDMKPTPATSTSSTPEPFPHKSSLSQYSFNDTPSSIKKSLDGKVYKAESLTPELDELDILEQKMRDSKRNRAKELKNKKIKEDFLSDDDISDDMSQDEYAESDGLTSMDGKVLEFLNNASSQDLSELGNVHPNVSKLIISMRPFDNIYAVAEENFEIKDESATNQDSKPKKRRGVKKPLGQKLIESIEVNLKGYRAVDSLVKQCSDVGDLVSKQMKSWGVSFTGSEGELEMVDIKPTNEVIEVEDENDEDDEVIEVSKPHKKSLAYIHEAPENFSPEFELKNYQIVGLNWINLLYTNNLSCILADEMGLGKTCQVISFMAHLKSSSDSTGPHLVVVPSSTLENWLREFKKFCPDIIVQAYYGSQAEREELRYELRLAKFDVLVTTYNLASGSSNDFKFLKNQNFDVVVYDEGHMLKNSNSERYSKLMRLRAKFRLLLTGTPLQNNLKELVSLLAFMLPHLFVEKKDDLQVIFNQKAKTSDADDDYNPLLSVQAISKAKTMMTPFVLRRKKAQVLSHLPAKTHKTEYCELTDTQREIYNQYLNEGKAIRAERERRKLLTGKEAEAAKKEPMQTSSNMLMALRKASLHPLLFRRHYTDEKLSKMSKLITNEPEYADANSTYIFEDMQVMTDYELDGLCRKFPATLKNYVLDESEFMKSGKITVLSKILQDIIDKKEKILVFSLFTQVLDILERVLSVLNIRFLRLDGQTSVEDRQDVIDTFYEDETIPVFLLSTRAGGFGINLVAANNVVIFDQSFNPHDDKQAEDRAHRVGQTKTVQVTRLISKGTVEENILQLAENKLQLDQSISTDANNNAIEEKATSLFEKILFAS